MKAALPFVVMIAMGAAWGATQPLSKIAVSEGYKPFGILFWQTVLVALILGALTRLQGRRMRWDPAALWLYFVIAMIGSVLPGAASYSAAVHLPSGVLSMLLSSVPMLAFPVALAMGNDTFRWRRLLGLTLGLLGVALLVLPQDGLPDGVSAYWVGIALISAACYALEGNYVAKWGTQGMRPVQVLTGASVLGLALTLPLAAISGQFIDPRGPWGAPDLAIIASSLLHAAAYTGYVWLVGYAGSVFAVQVSYMVTLFGVTWAIVFLGEGYSAWFWSALVVMIAGMALVQPRPNGLVPAAPLGNTGAG